MKNIERDIKLLENMLKYNEIMDKELINEDNSLTPFGLADKVYPFTNEYIKNYYYKNLDNKKVLSITSSADHIIHSIYAGATDITAFDINRFCKYYSALKIAMIKRYNFDNFVQNINNFISITPYNITKDAIKSFEISLSDISIYLTEDEINFFNKLIDIYTENNLSTSLFRYFHTIKSNIYYDKDNYNYLKHKIDNANVKYIDSGIDKLSNKVDSTYDFMYISNILSYVSELNIPYVLKDLSSIINKNGIICIPGSMKIPVEFYYTDDTISKHFNIKDEKEYIKHDKGRILLIKK